MIVETFLRNETKKPLIQKLDQTIKLEILRDEMWTILEGENKLQDCPSQQFMLATVPGVEAPGHCGCGGAEDRFHTHSLFKPEEFTAFHPKYIGYNLHALWKEIEPPIGRMFFMRVPMFSSLPVSENARDRLVAALWTQPDVYHLYENHPSWYHIPADGHLYYVNGKERQTIYNGTKEAAVYLMFELLGEP